MNDITVTGLCGSLRRGSYNLKLLKRAMALADAQGASLNTIDQKALGLPLYNGDIENAGFPEEVIAMKNIVEAGDVLLVATPEYNYSVSAALKNAIDWVSRVKPNPFKGKIAAIFGASTGPIGTARGQFQLRQILVTLGVIVVPQPQVYLALADENSFDADGSLKNKVIDRQLDSLVHEAIALAAALKKK